MLVEDILEIRTRAEFVVNEQSTAVHQAYSSSKSFGAINREIVLVSSQTTSLQSSSLLEQY